MHNTVAIIARYSMPSRHCRNRLEAAYSYAVEQLHGLNEAVKITKRDKRICSTRTTLLRRVNAENLEMLIAETIRKENSNRIYPNCAANFQIQARHYYLMRLPKSFKRYSKINQLFCHGSKTENQGEISCKDFVNITN